MAVPVDWAALKVLVANVSYLGWVVTVRCLTTLVGSPLAMPFVAAGLPWPRRARHG